MRILWITCLGFAIGCAPAEVSTKPASEPASTPAAPAPATTPAPAKSSAGADQFTPNPELVKQLGGPVEVGDYKISAPAGYELLQPPAPPGTNLSVWSSQRRPDGTAAMIQLLILTPPDGQPVPELDEALKKFIAGIQRRRTDWNQSEPKYGTLGGLKFVRQEWTGKDAASGTEMAGVMYVAVDGKSFIQLHTQDIQSQTDSLKLGETALQTFTKK